MTQLGRFVLASLLRLAVSVLPRVAGLGVFGGISWMAWWESSRSGFRNTWPLTFVLIVLVGGVVETISEIRSSRPRPVTDGVELLEDSQPALWAAVRVVIAHIEVVPPDRLYLGLDPTQVGLMTRTGRPGRRCRVLVLGVAPLCALSPQLWRAALTQALVMDQSGTSRERRLLRGQRWMTAVGSAPRSKWLRWLPSVPFRAHAWLAQPTCRRRQFDADLRSAELSSPNDAKLALLRVPAAELAWENFWEVHVQPAAAILRRPIHVVAGFRAYLSAIGIPDLPPTALELTSASHPFVSVETRLTALSVNTEPSKGGPGQPNASVARAVDLLGQPSVLVELELAWFLRSGLTPLDWDGLAHATASRESRHRAAWLLDEASTKEQPSNLSTVLQDLALTGGRTLQRRCVEHSHDDAEPDPDSDSDSDSDDQWFVASLVGDVIAAAVVETAGARYVMNWGGPATLVGVDDAVLDPWSFAATAVFEPDRAADLGQWCHELGVPADYRAVRPGPDLGRTIMDADPVVLCAACLYTDWRIRYVFVLDTGLIVMRPRLSDLIVGGLAIYGGDIGIAMLRRWSQRTGTELLSAKNAIYTDWTELRSVVMRTRQNGRVALELERVEGPSTKLKGNVRSRYDGHLAASLARFLGDRFVLHSQRPRRLTLNGWDTTPR